MPQVVFAASYLFAGVGTLALVSAFGGLSAISEYSYLQAKQAHDSAAGMLAGFGLILFSLLAVAFAALCVTLAFLDGRGSQVARVLTWVLGGLTICFNLLLLVVTAFESLPWYGELTRLLAVAMLILATASITLLALPASHKYFHAAKTFRRQQRQRTRPPIRPQPYPQPLYPQGPDLQQPAEQSADAATDPPAVVHTFAARQESGIADIPSAAPQQPASVGNRPILACSNWAPNTTNQPRGTSRITRRRVLSAVGLSAVAATGLGFSYALWANRNTPDEKWSFATDGWLTSAPAVVGETVYVSSSGGSDNGNLYAVDAATGEQRWVFSTGPTDPIVGGENSSPAVVDGTVYVGGGGSYDPGGLYAVDAATGAQLWTFPTDDAVYAPVVADGTVYISNYHGSLRAVDAATGQLRWLFSTDGLAESAPAVAGETVYFGSNNSLHSVPGKLYALDAGTGKERWVFPTDGRVGSPPALADRTLYVASGDTVVSGNLYAVDAATGERKWAFRTAGIARYPVVADGTVYVTSSDHNLYAVDAASGKQLWNFATRHEVHSAPAVADGIVYFGGSGNLYAVDAATGERKWAFRTDGMAGSPTVTAGTAYVGTAVGGGGGTLYAVNL